MIMPYPDPPHPTVIPPSPCVLPTFPTPTCPSCILLLLFLYYPHWLLWTGTTDATVSPAILFILCYYYLPHCLFDYPLPPSPFALWRRIVDSVPIGVGVVVIPSPFPFCLLPLIGTIDIPTHYLHPTDSHP